MSRPPLTDFEQQMGATNHTPVIALSCPFCGANLVMPVFGGPLPWLECERSWMSQLYGKDYGCNAPAFDLPAFDAMRTAGVPMLPGFDDLSVRRARDRQGRTTG